MGLDVQNRGAVKHIQPLYTNHVFRHRDHGEHGKPDGIRPSRRTDAEHAFWMGVMRRGLNQVPGCIGRALVKIKQNDNALPCFDVLQAALVFFMDHQTALYIG